MLVMEEGESGIQGIQSFGQENLSFISGRKTEYW